MIRSLFVLVFVAHYSIHGSEALCNWPKYFDLSHQYYKYEGLKEKFSWETNSRVKTDFGNRLNPNIESKTWISVLNSTTAEISYYKSMKNHINDNKTIYTCEEDLGNSKYVIKVTGSHMDGGNEVTHPTKYKCVEFIMRSLFVVQWRTGPESTNVPSCSGNFAEITPSPLIYFPIREYASYSDIHKYQKLFEQYQPCPKLGGFQMKVFSENGDEVIGDGCDNNYPSPRLEVECASGDGVRIIQSRKYCRRYSEGDVGAKLSCLATWEEGEYFFSVLLPNDISILQSFHCLRVNKKDPTTERAILFLDGICQSGDPDGLKSTFFQLELRRHEISSLCDDVSDQCNMARCETMQLSCPSTCGACPANTTLDLPQEIKGHWLAYFPQKRKRVIMTDKNISISDMGIFQAYGFLSKMRKVCLSPALPFTQPTVHEYALARIGDGHGCGPRVVQMRARRLSKSVLLLQTSSSSPLRSNEDKVNPATWCHNNYNDVQHFKQYFRPNAPFKEPVGRFWDNGFYTFIKETDQEEVKCLPDTKEVRYAAHLKIKLTFRNRHNASDICEGNSHLSGETNWYIKMNCKSNDKKEEFIRFRCLGNYNVSGDFLAVILKAELADIPHSTIPLSDLFYCIMIPRKEDSESAIYFHSAGECDFTFLKFVFNSQVEPIAKIERIETLSGPPTGTASHRAKFSLLIVLSFLFVMFI